uniref:Ovule protein n=1 Tax=Heterorhabditis bacteriophora TaxID=37862 RepID=A0A1I7XBC7_HETBA
MASYDFPYIVRTSRAIQFLCCVIQVLMVYSDSGTLRMIPFLFIRLSVPLIWYIFLEDGKEKYII